jgi:16S rRNA C967 or C1407 C5-methylase (RsmB/RsmF family)/NOL1/NOP2/fmu family ribosome biogenesis protein
VASPGLHPHHLAGLYYLQDPSAMAPAELLAPRPGERVLDLAAAPGGKTTHLAALMGGEGLLVANEIKSKRVGHLAQNLERWGAGNVVITNETPEALADHFGAFFDRVLVDAPCSGEGMFRKDMGARADWSPEMVAGCAVRQSAILRVAAKMVRPGGYLLYSTCTFAPEENEAVIAGLLGQAAAGSGMRFRPVALPQLDGFMPGRPTGLTSDGLRRLQSSGQSSRQSSGTSSAQPPGLDRAVRLFPHRVQGEGHFACLLQRVPSSADDQEEDLQLRSDRLPRPSKAQSGFWRDFAEQVLAVDLADDRLRVVGDRLYLVPQGLPDLGRLRVVHPGIWLGALKKDRLEPAHPLALFLPRGQARRTVDLPADDPRLRAYLRGESFPAEGSEPVEGRRPEPVEGWTLVTTDGFPLGWGKRVQGVVKNHFPRGWIQGQVR